MGWSQDWQEDACLGQCLVQASGQNLGAIILYFLVRSGHGNIS